MPNILLTKEIVINTGPILALIAGLNSLDILSYCYEKVYVPLEVSDELNFKNSAKYGADIFNSTDFLKKETQYQAIQAYLKNSIDIGEASFIQCALSRNIQVVCIDEAVGRRIARLNSLKITGSLGIIVKAIKNGFKADFDALVRNMLARNIYLLT